jgi:mediator of RNA polymerase II transcription subunit 10
MKGKEAAFRSFRDVLAREMESALPELKGDVRMVLEATGGVGEIDASGNGSGTGTGTGTGNGVQGEGKKDVDIKMED